MELNHKRNSNVPEKGIDERLPVKQDYTGEFTSNKEYYDILLEKFKSSDIITNGTVISFRSEGVHIINRHNLDEREILKYNKIASTKLGVSILGHWDEDPGTLFIQSPVSGDVVIKIMGVGKDYAIKGVIDSPYFFK